MKYLEELPFGTCFSYQNELFILTQDFTTDKNKCVNLNNGSVRWMKKQSTVEIIELYRLDHENNISPIKNESKTTI